MLLVSQIAILGSLWWGGSGVIIVSNLKLSKVKFMLGWVLTIGIIGIELMGYGRHIVVGVGGVVITGY